MDKVMYVKGPNNMHKLRWTSTLKHNKIQLNYYWESILFIYVEKTDVNSQTQL